MISYAIKRLLMLVPVFFAVSIVVFLILHLIPGDPIDNLIKIGSSPQQREIIAQRYGLDRSLPEQYAIWLGNLLRGDLGTAIVGQRQVSAMILQAIPYSFVLGGTALLFSTTVGIMLGSIAAWKRDSLADQVITGGILLGSTMPTFWLGLLMILFFSVYLGWFPVSGARSWHALVLPVLTIGLAGTALVARVTRVAMIEAQQRDFVTLLHAKGLPRWRIHILHVLRHALTAVVTVLALRIGWILGGAVTVEVVFARPGLGTLLIKALNQHDYPVVQASLLMLAMAVMLGTLLGDILQAALDPRVRSGMS